jgi:large subunit ribosomal protein L18
MDKKKKMKVRRHARIRAKINGTYDRPRLCVFRSNKYIYAQLVDDEFGKTLAAASDIGAKKEKVKTERAKEVGSLLAKAARSKKIKEVVFDRGGFIYTGRVKSLAESARKGGLVF